MIAEAQDKYPDETGGCFLGYYIEKNKEIVITDSIGPGPNAVHKKFYFKPDNKWQAEEIAKIYNESGRLHTYLGDWHVHSTPYDELSWKDKRTLRRIAKYTPARVKNPIMGIMSFYKEWRLVIWQIAKMRTFLSFDTGAYEKLDIKYF
jgi:integrative and conjugative element protein (TIGR02256 family)